MNISLIVEGKTEKAFVPTLRDHLHTLLPGKMPKLRTSPQNGRIPTGEILDRMVNNLLSYGKDPADHVIALTDVYPDYRDAEEAKAILRQSVKNSTRFHAHAAQYEFEAWLLPYWDQIQRMAGHNQPAPRDNPEQVNHHNWPSRRIGHILSLGNGRKKYSKVLDTRKILKNADLNVAIYQCPELKSLVNTILNICGDQTIP